MTKKEIKDEQIKNLNEEEFDRFSNKLIKDWKSVKITGSQMSPEEVKIIKKHCLTENCYGI